MRTRFLASTAVAALLCGLVAVPAGADTAPVTSTATIRNTPDDGSPAWARDTFARRTTITPGQEAGTYTVKITDTGSFHTVKGSASPNDPAVIIKRKDTGTISGSGEFTVTNATLKGHNGLNALDGKVFANGKYATKADVPAARSTDKWALQFFKPGAVSTSIQNWAWAYTRDCESMTETPNGVTGNITGKKCEPAPPAFVPSVLKAANKCRVSKSDKRNWWNITNVAGGRTRTYWLHVTYNHRTTYEGEHTVAAGATAPVRTSHGGKLKVGYYDGHGVHTYAYAYSDASKLCG